MCSHICASCVCTSTMPKPPLMHCVIRQTSQWPAIHPAVKGSSMEHSMAKYTTSLPFSQQV